ncbi:MAG TPA: shikimate kinase [Chthoniobacterales bacterium]|nr:shikimate kinase [Chthoniobacterales bacterium]
MRSCGQAIVMIGFMGSGKSAVGRAVAARLGVVCLDTDEMIRAHAGRGIPEIFEQLGEERFRVMEAESLEKLSGGKPVVVVTGGGIVLRKANVEVLQRLGLIVHLFADEETLSQRVSRRDNRPLLRTADPRTTLHELYTARKPIYEEAADVSIDTSRCSIPQVVELVLRGIAAARLAKQ